MVDAEAAPRIEILRMRSLPIVFGLFAVSPWQAVWLAYNGHNDRDGKTEMKRTTIRCLGHIPSHNRHLVSSEPLVGLGGSVYGGGGW